MPDATGLHPSTDNYGILTTVNVPGGYDTDPMRSYIYIRPHKEYKSTTGACHIAFYT